MKAKFYFILISFILLAPVFFACSPVRSGSYQKSSEQPRTNKQKSKTEPATQKSSSSKSSLKKKSSSEKSDNAIIERKTKKAPSDGTSSIASDSANSAKYKKRFSDTVVTRVVIDMKKNINAKEKELEKLFESLENKENIEENEKACETLLKYSDFSGVSDSIKSNALFYKGECLLNKTDVDGALKCFEEAISENIDLGVIEKSLVRLGHIFCYRKDFEKAEMYFAELKNRFPESIYLPMANCESVNDNNSE